MYGVIYKWSYMFFMPDCFCVFYVNYRGSFYGLKIYWIIGLYLYYEFLQQNIITSQELLAKSDCDLMLYRFDSI